MGTNRHDLLAVILANESSRRPLLKLGTAGLTVCGRWLGAGPRASAGSDAGGRSGSGRRRGAVRLRRHLHAGRAGRRRRGHPGRHLGLRGRRRHRRAVARPDRAERQPVVPGPRPDAAIPLRDQRGRRLRGRGDRLDRGLRDRPGDRRADAAQPRGRRRRRSRPTSRSTRPAASSSSANYIGANYVVLPIRDDGGLDPVSGEIVNSRHRPERRAPGGAPPARRRLRPGRPVHRHRRPRHRQGPDLPPGHSRRHASSWSARSRRRRAPGRATSPSTPTDAISTSSTS